MPGEVSASWGDGTPWGGQQFLTDGVLLDTRYLNRILHLDADKGQVKVEAGILWDSLVSRPAGKA